MADAEEPTARWVQAIVIGGGTTVTQRQRNFALYQRLKDGYGDRREFDTSGLSGFVYDVPIEQLRIGPSGKSFSFRLDKDGECFARLLHAITDHFDTKCDADDEVERLRARVAELEAKLGATT